ncbi:MAG: hypothetical protein JSW39_23090 [Desulfobacterales bacterium]|nr:MAG: hypothetical protein JSW39_23090 [Desulfobacterales bacterium]
MLRKNSSKRRLKTAFTGLVLVLAVLTAATAVYSHGGKQHGGNAFTHLQALQKATELYDGLIAKGKLDESWEIHLAQVAVANRQHNNQEEVVVAFHRNQGNPPAVFIFFTADGKYAGSNFTGE